MIRPNSTAYAYLQQKFAHIYVLHNGRQKLLNSKPCRLYYQREKKLYNAGCRRTGIDPFLDYILGV